MLSFQLESARCCLMFINIKLRLKGILIFVYQGLVTPIVEMGSQLCTTNIAFAHVTRFQFLRVRVLNRRHRSRR